MEKLEVKLIKPTEAAKACLDECREWSRIELRLLALKGAKKDIGDNMAADALSAVLSLISSEKTRLEGEYLVRRGVKLTYEVDLNL